MEQLFERLARSDFRSKFTLKQKEKDYIREKGWDTIRSHTEDFVEKRVRELGETILDAFDETIHNVEIEEL